MKKILPPGNILQNLFLKERIKQLKSHHRFLEIGSGNGTISHILLNHGFKGVGYDLNNEACLNNKILNQKYLKNQKYEVVNDDFLNCSSKDKFDIIISSMVIEHLENEFLDKVFRKIISIMNDGGIIIALVPSSMKYWGIEDEIAGHYKRYEFEDVIKLSEKYNLKINNLTGLTFPISNVLFKISNYLIRKNEKDKLNLTLKERTVYTGNRQVKFKTRFPNYFGIFLNEYTLYPFHILQKLFSKNRNSMVIYFEMKKTK